MKFEEFKELVSRYFSDCYSISFHDNGDSYNATLCRDFSEQSMRVFSTKIILSWNHSIDVFTRGWNAQGQVSIHFVKRMMLMSHFRVYGHMDKIEIDIPDAGEARKLINRNAYQKAQEQADLVSQKIKEAIAKKKDTIWIDEVLETPVRSYIESLGYVVNVVSEYNETSTSIKW